MAANKRLTRYPPIATALQRLAFILLAALLLSPLAPQVQAQTVSAPAIKAAMLLKLPRFVYYPNADSEEPVRLCVLGQHPFDGVLERLVQQPIDGRKVELPHQPELGNLEPWLASAPQGQLCDFLFIAAHYAEHLPGILQVLEKRPIVTVSDIVGFAQAGGMLELAPNPQDPQRLAIFVNPAAAAAQGIRFNAQLLRLATVVKP